MFGATQPAQPQSTSLFGNAFGQNNNNLQQNTNQPATGGFGTSLFAPKPSQPTTSLFGNTQPQAQAQPTSLFGNNNNAQQGTGLFGNLGANNQQQQQQQQPQQTSIFGPKPGGLFGSAAPAQTTFGGGGLFGGQQNNAGGSIFGTSQATGQQQQPQLVATIDGNIYNTNPLLANSTSQAHIITPNDPDKKASLQYTKKFVPKVGIPKVRPLRGFSTPPPNGLGFSQSAEQSPFNRPLSVNSSRLGNALGGLSGSASASNLTAEAFKPKVSVKKLILPTRVDPQAWTESVHAASQGLYNELGSSPVTRSKVTWDPQLSRAARESPTLAPRVNTMLGSPSTTPLGKPPPGRTFGAQSPVARLNLAPTEPTPTKSPVGVLKNKKPDPSKIPGEYWTEPSLSELRDYTYDRLARLEHFKVHRTGFGVVEFLQPVNLTTLKSIDEIPGIYVTFDSKECIVYPDESEKPAMGEGLNVPARISLVGCWPMDKSTRQPITDPKNPKTHVHMKKLQAIKDTKFVDYDLETGTWTFEVPHFTRYGLDDDDEDDLEEEDVMQTLQPAATMPLVNGSSVYHSAFGSFEQPKIVEDDRSESEEMEDVDVDGSSGRADSMSADEVEEHIQEEAPQPSRAWPSTLGLNPQRVAVMQASFFHTAEEPTLTPRQTSRLARPPEMANGLHSSGVSSLSLYI